MLKNRLFSNISLAQKAGKVASGEYATEMAVKSGKAYMVIVAEDASDNTKKKMMNMTQYYEVPIHMIGTKEELGVISEKNIVPCSRCWMPDLHHPLKNRFRRL